MLLHSSYQGISGIGSLALEAFNANSISLTEIIVKALNHANNLKKITQPLQFLTIETKLN